MCKLVFVLFVIKMAQILGRQIARNFRRKYSELAGKALLDDMKAQQEHAASTTRTWKLISMFIAGPAILYCTYNAYTKEVEHHEHPRPDFVPFKHLRVRAKPFPWGDGNHSLFHNGHANALPEGYEE